MEIIQEHGFVEGQLCYAYQYMRRSAVAISWEMEHPKPDNCKIRFNVYRFLQGYDLRLPGHIQYDLHEAFNFMLKIVDPLDDIRSLLDIIDNQYKWLDHKGAIWYRITRILSNIYHKSMPQSGYFSGLVLPHERYPGLPPSITHIFLDGTFVRNNGDYSLLQVRKNSEVTSTRRNKTAKTHLPKFIEPCYLHAAISRCEDWKFPELKNRGNYISKYAQEFITHKVLKKRDVNYVIPNEFKPLPQIIQSMDTPWYSNNAPTSWLEVLGASK